MKPYDQAALDEASRQVHMHLLREGSSWGTKACEEMGRVFMTAYLKALPTEALRTEWIALTERLPAPEIVVLVANHQCIATASMSSRPYPSGEIDWRMEGIGGYECEWEFTPTHWMPAPAYPSDGPGERRG